MISRRLFGLTSAAGLLLPNALRAQAVMDPRALSLNAELYLPHYLDLIARSASGDLPAQQELTQFAAFVGDEARATVGSASRYKVPETLQLMAEPAIACILERARDKRVVILNEHHCISRHRSFAAQVLRALRPLGFDIFAAETFQGKPLSDFANPVENLREGMSFRPMHGYYSRDPVFAETAREALQLGYRLAAYEQTREQVSLPREATPHERISAREDAQARNLIDHVLTPNPDSKIVVLCGHSHVVEAPLGENEWFAARLKRYSGIDPLTIEQAGNYPAFSPDNDPPLTKAVLERLSPDQPVCVFEPSGLAFTSSSLSGKVDLSVFHPRKPTVNGRPDWWANEPQRRPAPVNFPPHTGLSLIQAIPITEGMGAVPADHVLIEPGGTEVALSLRPGTYVIRREADGGWQVLGQLRVPEEQGP